MNNLDCMQFAIYIVGDKCDGINKLLAAIDSRVPYNGIDKCFDVITTLTSVCRLQFMTLLLFVCITVDVMN